MVKNADSGQQENLGANKLTRLKQTLTTGLQQAQDSGLSFIFIFFYIYFFAMASSSPTDFPGSRYWSYAYVVEEFARYRKLGCW